MNTTTPPFPPPGSALKLPRRSVSSPAASETEYAPTPAEAEQRRQLEADLTELREREANLREYEARLRAWQDQLDADVVLPKAAPIRAASGAPFGASQDLQAAWEKFHRAHALLEAEQRQMRVDRIVSQENEANVQRREAELTAREASLVEREQIVAEKMALIEAAESAAAEEKPLSAMQRLTQAPLMAARSVFKATK